jgi:hypothetical protein
MSGRSWQLGTHHNNSRHPWWAAVEYSNVSAMAFDPFLQFRPRYLSEGTVLRNDCRSEDGTRRTIEPCILIERHLERILVEDRVTEIRRPQVDTQERRPHESGASTTGTSGIHIAERRLDQIGAVERRAAQVCVIEVDPYQGASCQVGSAQVGSLHVGAVQFRAHQPDSRQLGVDEAGFREIAARKVCASEIEPYGIQPALVAVRPLPQTLRRAAVRRKSSRSPSLTGSTWKCQPRPSSGPAYMESRSRTGSLPTSRPMPILSTA